MDQKLIRFLRSLGLDDVTPFLDCSFDKCAYLKEKDILDIVIYCPILLSYLDAKRLLEAVERAEYKVLLSFKYGYGVSAESVYKLIEEEFIFNTGLNKEHLPSCVLSKKAVTFTFTSLLQFKSFEPVLEMWETLLNDLQINNISIETELKYSTESEIEKREEELKKSLAIIGEKYHELLERLSSSNVSSKRIRGNYEPVELKDLSEEMQNISFKGQVFHSTKRTYKRNGVEKEILTLYVYDKTDSVEVIIFENKSSFKRSVLDELEKPGKVILVRGFVKLSDYTHELQVTADYISVLDEEFNIPREDKAEEKRVELHLHSKMSTMDGVATITDYCKLASSWGHKAIAITDHGVVQSFPEAQKAAEKNNLKMIYGTEGYMVEDHLEYIFNPSDVVLNKAEYVIFDFETTGLSSRYDRIIEFGAVKLRDGMIVDNMDLFIDPEMELSEFTTRLTNITNFMVRGKTKIKEALKIIQDFIGDAVLVAHNASFDVGFLNEAFLNNGGKEITNPVVDTLALAWYLFPEAKFHNLGAVARRFETPYDENVAHRANYDAEVLCGVWQAMLALLTKNNRDLKHAELASLTNSLILKNMRPNHLTLYAKNKKGLRDLFELVSLAHTEYMYNVPKMPRSIIEKKREDLIIGSGCFNGEVFNQALTKGKKQLKEAMKFYDFIEVQPPDNYLYLINSGQIHSQEEVKKIIKDIVDAAEELNIPVVATGDAHYLNPEDKIVRDIYIAMKGVGGLPHPLLLRRKEGYENPSQHFRTTDEMLNDFAFLGEEKDKEIVVTNSNYIAELFDELKPIHDKLYTPHIENCDKLLVDMCYQKAKEMYGNPLPKLVEDRLAAELDGITKYGYFVIYYIAHRIVKQSREDGFMVGSRGSVGSSFVATMSSITEVNPLPPHYRCPNCKHSEFIDDINVKSGFDLPDKVCPECGTKMIQDGQNIPFATFLGFKAEKVPDIDLNFSGDYQARAHDLTKTLLGAQNVYRAGTIETVAEKTALKYVYGYLNEIKIDPATVRLAEKTRLALKAQDVKRTTGQHPGGIIVIPDSMSVFDFTPIQYPADDKSSTWKTTHLDFHAIHDNVLKLDLLGHVDPTAMKMLGDITGINPETVPLTDKKMISLFSSDAELKRHSNYLNETTGALGLPEFGTNFVRGMLKETKPKTFADLLIISGLSHGTDVWNGNAQDLIRSGTCSLRDVIGCRDDIMIYLSKKGIDPSKAFKIMESVRKGKKIAPEDEQILREAKIPDYFIDSCNKIKYLFPRAHAVAYVMMACRVAWYKVYYPLAYYATFFSTRSKQFDIKVMVEGEKAIIAKLEEYKKAKENGPLSPKDEEIEKTLLIALEMAERGYQMSNIDLYKSHHKNFIVDQDSGTIIPPFSVIDGLGDGPALSVVVEREKMEFLSQEDLLMRTELNQQNVENLKNLGVFKDLPESNQLTLF